MPCARTSARHMRSARVDSGHRSSPCWIATSTSSSTADELVRSGTTVDTLGRLAPSFRAMGEDGGFDAVALQKYHGIERINHDRPHARALPPGRVEGAGRYDYAVGRRTGLWAGLARPSRRSTTSRLAAGHRLPSVDRRPAAVHQQLGGACPGSSHALEARAKARRALPATVVARRQSQPRRHVHRRAGPGERGELTTSCTALAWTITPGRDHPPTAAALGRPRAR